MNRIDLVHCCAVVTGGAQGIGLSLAKRLLESQCSVALWDVQHESLKRAANELFRLGKVSTSLVDVTDPEGVQTAALHMEDMLGSVNILVTSAGVACAGNAGPNAKSWDYLAEAWQDQCQFEWNLLLLPGYPAANIEAWLRTNRHDCINRRKRR